MTSTQRSESMNFVLKRSFVREEGNLHKFAKEVNNCIQTRHEAENAEKIASMVCFLILLQFRLLRYESSEYIKKVHKYVKF